MSSSFSSATSCTHQRNIPSHATVQSAHCSPEGFCMPVNMLCLLTHSLSSLWSCGFSWGCWQYLSTSWRRGSGPTAEAEYSGVHFQQTSFSSWGEWGHTCSIHPAVGSCAVEQCMHEGSLAIQILFTSLYLVVLPSVVVL